MKNTDLSEKSEQLRLWIKNTIIMSNKTPQSTTKQQKGHKRTEKST